MGLPGRNVVLAPNRVLAGHFEGKRDTYQLVTMRLANVGVARAASAEAIFVKCMIMVLFELKCVNSNVYNVQWNGIFGEGENTMGIEDNIYLRWRMKGPFVF
jgi:hypothetical protein